MPLCLRRVNRVVLTYIGHFRSTPTSGHCSTQSAGRICAKNRLAQASLSGTKCSFDKLCPYLIFWGELN